MSDSDSSIEFIENTPPLKSISTWRDQTLSSIKVKQDTPVKAKLSIINNADSKSGGRKGTNTDLSIIRNSLAHIQLTNKASSSVSAPSEPELSHYAFKKSCERSFTEINAELEKHKKLLSGYQSILPDKGAKLKENIDRLSAELRSKTDSTHSKNFTSNLNDDQKGSPQSITNSESIEIQNPNKKHDDTVMLPERRKELVDKLNATTDEQCRQKLAFQLANLNKQIYDNSRSDSKATGPQTSENVLNETPKHTHAAGASVDDPKTDKNYVEKSKTSSEIKKMSPNSISQELSRAIQKQKILRQQLSLVTNDSEQSRNVGIELANCNKKIYDLKAMLSKVGGVPESSSQKHVDQSSFLRLPKDVRTSSSNAGELHGREKLFNAWRDSTVVDSDDIKFIKEVNNVDNKENSTKKVVPLYGGRMNQERYDRVSTITQDALRTFSDALKTMPNESEMHESTFEGLKSSISLFDHQRQALSWLKWRESEEKVPRGGIFADDMGLGKTLTMISLMVVNSERSGGARHYTHPSSSSAWLSKNSNLKERKSHPKACTLVVCPASLIMQWETEVQKKTSTRTLNVFVYHGNTRREIVSSHKLCKYDMVITTYGSVMSENKGFSALNYHDEDRLSDNDFTKKTTKTTKDKNACIHPLFDVEWERIILDEGHVIRNPKAQTSQAVCNLRSLKRWLVTGTPIQNSPLDMYSLIKFLKMSPFDEYKVWKLWVDNKTPQGEARMQTLVKCILLRRTKHQTSCLTGQPIIKLPERVVVQHSVSLSVNEKEVYDDVYKISKQAMMNFMNNRGEMSGQNARSFVNSGVRDTNPSSGSSSMKGGEQMMPQKIKTHHIFVLLLRLRQMCCHPILVKSMLTDIMDLEQDCVLKKKEEDNESDNNGVSPSHLDDITSQLSHMGLSSSAKHNGERDDDIISKENKDNFVFKKKFCSSKIENLLKCVRKVLDDSEDKVVIVSQWTSMLDIIQFHINKALDDDIHCVAINGDVAIKERGSIVERFNEEGGGSKKMSGGSSLPPPRIMLLSLSAGGVGLNLTAANHLFLVDISWNPQLEAQACDRIYRMGQKKKVFIHKFIVENSIETRIVELQEKKIQLADSVLTGAARTHRLTFNDIKTLFGIK